jgi:hypothetical protein
LPLVVEVAAAAGIHAEVGTDLAADAGGEGRVVQDQFQRFLHLALTEQIDAVLGRNLARTGTLTWGAIGLVLPVGYLQPVLAGVDQSGTRS